MQCAVLAVFVGGIREVVVVVVVVSERTTCNAGLQSDLGLLGVAVALLSLKLLASTWPSTCL